MVARTWHGWTALAILSIGAVVIAATGRVSAQASSEDRPDVLPPPTSLPAQTVPPIPFTPPAPAPGDKPLPINLPTALSLAGVRPLDIALASQRVRIAAAELERAQYLWLPSVYLGVDYF